MQAETKPCEQSI